MRSRISAPWEPAGSMRWPCWAPPGSDWTEPGCGGEVRGAVAPRAVSARRGDRHGPGAVQGTAVRLRHQCLHVEGLCGRALPVNGADDLPARGAPEHHLAPGDAGLFLADDRRLPRGLGVA